MHPFSTPLKTSQNRKAFWYFQGVGKGCTGNEWVRVSSFWLEIQGTLLFAYSLDINFSVKVFKKVFWNKTTIFADYRFTYW